MVVIEGGRSQISRDIDVTVTSILQTNAGRMILPSTSFDVLSKRIIPCLDVFEGRVVKGTNFVNLRDAGDPVEIARRYESEGADELVFLDITASHEKRNIMLDVVQRCAEQVFMPLTVGGGIRTLDDVRMLLSAGCDKVSINSTACKEPEFVRRAADRFGRQCIVVNIDPSGCSATDASFWEVHIYGGRTRRVWKRFSGHARLSNWGRARLS